jgi:hypothetical protein
MKHILTLLALVVGGAALAPASSANDQTVKSTAVTVVRIQGQARYSLGDNQWHPLVAGKVLKAGAVIQTAADSMVDLVLSGDVPPMPQPSPAPDKISLAPDSPVRGMISYKPMVAQNVIRMWGDSVLAIDKLTVSETGVDTISDTELDLRTGRIFANVRKLSAASQYLVKIPNGIAGVRGTSFTISANGVIAVFTGSVVFSYIGPDGKPVTVVINGGEKYDLNIGEPVHLSPQELDVLNKIVCAVPTFYLPVVSFANDRTTVCVSPTTGRKE